MKNGMNRILRDVQVGGVLVGGFIFGGITFVSAQDSPAEVAKVTGEGGETVSADPLERGRELAAKGSLEDALPLLREAAEAGSVEAEELCALALVKLDRRSLYEEARTRLARAVKLGSVVALEEQARIALEGGLGKNPDYDLAKELCEKAIRQPGASESYFLLGKMAAEGLGRDQDAALAVSFMRRGEEAGSASAMFALGQLYLGEGGLVDRDLKQAEELFEKAYLRKNAQAAFYLGMIEERLRGEEPSWERAREWFVKASQLGSAEAFQKLGDYALAGRGSDEQEAFRFYQTAAGLESAEAAYTLGLLYHNGRTVPKDQVAAAAWMRIAADRGHTLAQNQLGLWLLTGLGVSPKFEEAVALFEKSASRGYPTAQFNFAILLMDAERTPEERKRAAKLLESAAGNGHAEAAARLSKLYQSGEIVEASDLEAAFWAAKAGKDDRFRELAVETEKKLSGAQKKELAARLQAP